MSRGTRVSSSLLVGCDVGERVWLPIEVREPTVADGSEFKVVVVGAAKPSSNAMLEIELDLGRPLAA